MNKFCVISPFVDASGTARTWKSSQEAAIRHAQQLLASTANRPSRRPKKLYVVEIVSVVEVPLPQTTVRPLAPEDDDAAPSLQEQGEDDEYNPFG